MSQAVLEMLAVLGAVSGVTALGLEGLNLIAFRRFVERDAVLTRAMVKQLDELAALRSPRVNVRGEKKELS